MSHTWEALAVDQIRDMGQFAWPGGYEVFFLTEEGLTLCQPCALAEGESGFEQGPVFYGGSAADTDEYTLCDGCYREVIHGPDEDCPICDGTGDDPRPDGIYCECPAGHRFATDEDLVNSVDGGCYPPRGLRILYPGIFPLRDLMTPEDWAPIPAEVKHLLQRSEGD